MLNASSATTETDVGVPAVAEAALVTETCVAAPAETLTVFDVPVIEDVTVSVAVTVWLPAVFRVALNVPVPPASVAFAGNTATPSLDVKCTVPA